MLKDNYNLRLPVTRKANNKLVSNTHAEYKFNLLIKSKVGLYCIHQCQGQLPQLITISGCCQGCFVTERAGMGYRQIKRQCYEMLEISV